MITDPVPRAGRKRELYAKSDALVSLPLPSGDVMQPLTKALEAAMATEERPLVRAASAGILEALARFYGIPVPEVRVLGVRPHVVRQGVCTYQLFGDYTPSTQRIRVWMRTAIREKVSSPKALLNTLLHEFCHHLDNTRYACAESPHTRGFFCRIDHLYHLCLATPPEARGRLTWVKYGSGWRIDWVRSRARAATTRGGAASI